MNYVGLLVLSAALAAIAAARIDDDAVTARAALATGGDPAEGRAAMERYGCGACHTIPGVRGADAVVAPPLNRIASRAYIGGMLVNRPDQMVRWIKDPTAVDPRTAMPNLRVSDADAKDIAAHLYTLR